MLDHDLTLDPLDTTPLTPVGWTPTLQRQLSELALDPTSPEALCAGRVAIEHRGHVYDVITPAGTVEATLPGRLRHAAASRLDLPAVGDWLVLDLDHAQPRVHALLPRASCFVRKAAGQAVEVQVVAANVDTVFVVTSCNADFSPPRLERYRRAIRAGGATPVVVLNKTDLLGGDDDAVAIYRDAVPDGLEVACLSALAGDGLDALRPWLLPGRTVALAGSSGVGKSTLVNALVGDARQATRPLRARDETGTHTTTRRELVPLPSGAVLVDTPGMRELALWALDQSSDESQGFEQVEALAEACRFRDCRHEDEPGCAVREAIEAGELPSGELASRRKLEQEAARQKVRQNDHLRRQAGRALKKKIKAHQAATQWRKGGSR